MQGYKAATLKSAPPKPAPTTTTNNNGVGANGSKKNNSKKKPEKTVNGESDGAAPRAPPPGFASKPASAPPVGFSEQEQRLLRHRALFVFRFLVGKAVEVTLVDASRYVGILDCIDPDDFSIVLKNTQRKNADSTASSTEAAIGSGSTVIFKRRQLAHMAADGVVNYGETAVGVGAVKAAAGFRTDTEISNRSHEHLFGRELESATSWLDPQLDTGELEDPRRRSSSKANWNQFEANEKLFGVVSAFDENLYTTKLDKSKVSTEKSREAERLAREIERETTGNFHLQEERGQAMHGDEDLDEETRYSSVDRKQTSNLARSTNAYVPPALRSRPNSAGTSGPKRVSPKTQTPPPVAVPAATPAKVSTPAPKTAPVAAQPATAPSSSAAPAPKPFSFSDAVRGRSAAKPTPVQPPAAPTTATPAPAGAKQSAKQQPDRKPVTASPKPQPAEKAAAPTSSPKKATSPSASKKEAKAAAKPASASSDKKPEAIKSDKKVTAPTKESEQTAKPPTAKSESSAAATTTTTTTPTSTSTTPAPAKKGLNPNAREFKLSASASAFTPKFATAPATSSPYRQPAVGGHHMPAPLPHPAMTSMGYSPVPDEWMYDGSGMMMADENEYATRAAYMGYGVPMMPNPAMMQPAMYAPMMPPQQNMRVPRGAAATGAGYAPGMYNPRGYYGQHGAVPAGMPYHPGAVPPVTGGVPQPPLPPTDPSGGEGAAVVATPSNAETPVKK